MSSPDTAGRSHTRYLSKACELYLTNYLIGRPAPMAINLSSEEAVHPGPGLSPTMGYIETHY